MAHGVMEWKERDKSPAGGAGRVMGSRRIFAPQFKLQVLDSYRQDADCKGNQRATARKYGIHRRQIQKWLQMEDHLRNITSSGGGGVASPLTMSPVASPRPASASMPEPQAPAQPLGLSMALNLSCESRLHVGAGLSALLGAGLGSVSAVSAVSGGYTSPSRSVSPIASPTGSPRDSPVGSPAPQVVPVPRLSVSPTLPIKKRWCPEYETGVGAVPEASLALSLAPSSQFGSLGSPLATEDEDDDEEDIDVDGTESETSSAPSSALDYTTATLSKRRSFSLQFKLDVLDAFRVDPLCQGNQRATARAFGINRRQVQKWLGQENDLREEAVSRGGLNRQRLGRWMDQDGQDHCLDLRKRKAEAVEDRDDVEDAETEAKRSRMSSPASSPCSPSSPPALPRPSPPAVASPISMSGRPHALAPHPLLFRPQPLPLLPHLPLPFPPLPFNVCAKQYSVDLNLKMSTLDLYTAHQQNLQKWLKPEHFLNSFR